MDSKQRTVRRNTMRQTFIFFLTILSIHLFGQTNVDRVFKKTEYDIDGSVSTETLDTIKTNGQRIDIYFLRNHFDVPYYLPDTFADKRYKRQTITVWRDSLNKNDFKNNWTNTYTYDGSSRVTNYTYSGCLICSNMPYNYSVTYNISGQILRIENTISEKDAYRIYYNDKGDIKQFDDYSSNKLQTRLILLE